MAKKREYTRRKWRIGKKWNYITDQWLYYVESRRSAFKIFKYWEVLGEGRVRYHALYQIR